MKILFYISGHGLGHATRVYAVMNALAAKEPDAQVFLRTQVPINAFDGLSPGFFQADEVAIDVGVVEKDIFSQDIHATLSRYARIDSVKNHLIDDEVRFIKQKGIQVIVSDIPPLASEIGFAADIPTIAIGNFSWDFIYEPYVLQYPAFGYLLDEIRSAYEKTTLLMRLPLHHEMTAFPRQRDIPFAVRKPRTDPMDVRARLGIPANSEKRIVAIALRMDNVVPSRAIQELVESNEFIVLSFVSLPFEANPTVHVIGPEWRRSEFPDLLAISDVVICKLGYGIVSECIVAQVPLIYVPRDDFAEYEILETGSRDLLPSYLMPRDDFLKGNWYDHIKAFLSFNFTWPSVRTDGADIAATTIISYAT